MRHITDFEPSELSKFLDDLKQPQYRTMQIYGWILRQGADSFDKMLNLPKPLRETLKEHIAFSFPQKAEVLASKDGTKKFFLRLTDGTQIETVSIRGKGRLTLCLSTQAGCRQGCTFCVTGYMGFMRSLLHHEISDQVLIVSRLLMPEKPTHIVIMGMGEPLDNYIQTIKAVKSLIDPLRGAFPPGRITLSTVGLIPGIEELGRENLGINLAVSLNAPNDKLRNALMPVNRRFPLADLIKCISRYPLRPRQRITFEYCLMRGINDSNSCARELACLLKGFKKGRFKINLIPYNPNPVLPFHATTKECLERFHGYLTGQGIMATVRKSRGGDILAACGQLGYRDKVEKLPFIKGGSP